MLTVSLTVSGLTKATVLPNCSSRALPSQASISVASDWSRTTKSTRGN